MVGQVVIGSFVTKVGLILTGFTKGITLCNKVSGGTCMGVGATVWVGVHGISWVFLTKG